MAERKKTKGIVYLVSNPKFDEVKIGLVRSVEVAALKKRINQMQAPAPYELHFAVEVNDVKLAEKLLHVAFDGVRGHGEFFEILLNRAKAAMELLLITGKVSRDIRNYMSGGKQPTAPERTRSKRRVASEIKFPTLKKQPLTPGGKFRDFYALDIPQGAKLTFLNDSTIQATVHGDNRVKYKENEYSLSGAAGEVLRSRGKKTTVAGTRYWLYEGKTVSQIARDMSGKKQLTTSEHTRGKQRVTSEIKSPTPKKQSPASGGKLMNFYTLGIPQGAKLTFLNFPDIQATVCGDNRIRYKGKEHSLSGAAGEVRRSQGKKPTVAGPQYWLYEGKTVSQITNERKQSKKALPFKLSNYQIPLGAVLTFRYNSSYTAKVADDDKIIFENAPMSLTKAAKIALEHEGRYAKNVPGPSYWKYKGELLTDIRNRMEGKS